MFPHCMHHGSLGAILDPQKCVSQNPWKMEAGLATWRVGSAKPAHQEYGLRLPPQPKVEGQTGAWPLRPPLILGTPGTCSVHSRRVTWLEGRQPLMPSALLGLPLTGHSSASPQVWA